MSNEELEQAHDLSCISCVSATNRSSDGGKMPCLIHKQLFQQRTYPVLKMSGMMEGEWTHSWIDTEDMNMWLEAILTEHEESDLTIGEFLRNLNLKVVQMTKEDYQRIPEL